MRKGDASHNKGKKFPPEPLTHPEMLKLLATCSKRAPTGVRDKALIVVLWRGQLRISEALALKPKNFDADACTLRVERGKGGKYRVAVIDHEAAKIIAAWLSMRENLLGLGKTGRIFCTLKGTPMSGTAVRLMLPRRAKKAGIAKRVHPHGLRHTGASELAAEGVAIKDIQEQLGHSSVATTDKYLHLINPAARIERLRSREW